MKKLKNNQKMTIVNANAAGIDVGSKSHFVAIGQRAEDVREFHCYTSNLKELCLWLKEKGITTVALESTGNYWQALFVLLQGFGLNPIMVNGKFTKNVKGRKTDVQDCQWIQKLHTLGLLEGSFIPNLFTEKLRQYCRHRQTLLENAADYIKKMQKALRLSNIRLDVAIRDIVGQSGRAIIEAIIAGETDPRKLASLAHWRVSKSEDEIAEALTGDWRHEYVFELKQSYDLYKYLHAKISECDKEIENILNQRVEEMEKIDGEQRAKYTGKVRRLKKNDPDFNLQELTFQMSGAVDLGAIEGVGRSTIMTILSETGIDMGVFPTAKHFASWLHLSPNNKISGGKIISSRTFKAKNRLADALRHAANAIGNMVKPSALHQFFKRIEYRKSRIDAITATARKLAVIIWNMLTNKQPYQPLVQHEYLIKVRNNQVKNLQRKIRQLNVKPEELSFVTS